ncbi:MAG TPA: hypothetical protein VHE59_20020 [Mucilaginibacter sp.]|nr:hypothetical protein [Bacteroidota bacterium]HVS94340.1 hypothetical protein [Mucilaginibacter sp.]
MKFLANLVIIMAYMLLAGCQSDPFAGDYTTGRPKFTDVPGTYRLERQTITENPLSKADMKATLTLNADGTFIMRNVPNLLGDTGKYVINEKITCRGKWDIQVVGGVDNGLGREKKHWGISLQNAPDNLSTIGLMNDAPPYKLIVNNDDPDLGKAIIFSKK